MTYRKLLSFIMTTLFATALWAQSGIYVPSAKPVKNMKKALEQPDVFCLILYFAPGDTVCKINDLDLLDSAYRIAFDRESPKLYTMTIESYGDNNEAIGRARVESVFRYFAQRCHAQFPIRYAVNPIHCSCKGDSNEIVRYEVPVSRMVYNCADLPDSRKLFNKSIQLPGSVMITFQHNPDECIGSSRGCFLPSQDSTIRGYYTSMILKRGSVYSVTNTKDECPPPLEISIEEHLDYAEVVERYFLVPHRRQIIAQAGYIVIHSNFQRKPGECTQVNNDTILIRFPLTEYQYESKLRAFAKVHTEKGVEYKSIATRKVRGKKGSTSITVEARITPSQFDTIFLGKRIQEEDIHDYFYPVKNNTEQGTITIGGKYYKAYKLDSRGDYLMRPSMEDMLRIIEEQEEYPEPQPRKKRGSDDDEEIIE